MSGVWQLGCKAIGLRVLGQKALGLIAFKALGWG